MFAGSSAGAGGVEYWNDIVLKMFPAQHAAVVMDSAFAVIPPPSPTFPPEFLLFASLGVCTSDTLPLTLLSKCATQNLGLTDIIEYNAQQNPLVTYLLIQSKMDFVQLSYLSGIGASFGFPSIGPTEYFPTILPSLEKINQLPNMLFFVVEGFGHTFSRLPSLATTTETGCGDVLDPLCTTTTICGGFQYSNAYTFCKKAPAGSASLLDYYQKISRSEAISNVCLGGAAQCGELAIAKSFAPPKPGCMYATGCETDLDCVQGTYCKKNNGWSQCLEKPSLTGQLTASCHTSYYTGDWGCTPAASAENGGCCNPFTSCDVQKKTCQFGVDCSAVVTTLRLSSAPSASPTMSVGTSGEKMCEWAIGCRCDNDCLAGNVCIQNIGWSQCVEDPTYQVKVNPCRKSNVEWGCVAGDSGAESCCNPGASCNANRICDFPMACVRTTPATNNCPSA